MIIYIAGDSWGYSLEKAIYNHLKERPDIEVVDYGIYSKYWDAAHAVGLEVEKAAITEMPTANCCSSLINSGAGCASPVRGILVCGSGQGMCVVANKFRHVNACLCSSAEDAVGCRSVNNSNIITFGCRTTDEATAIAAVDAWLSTSFTQGLAPNLQELVNASIGGIAALDFTHTAQRKLADALPEDSQIA
jgi:ribose 5-phosphate isomerase B